MPLARNACWFALALLLLVLTIEVVATRAEDQAPAAAKSQAAVAKEASTEPATGNSPDAQGGHDAPDDSSAKGAQEAPGEAGSLLTDDYELILPAFGRDRGCRCRDGGADQRGCRCGRQPVAADLEIDFQFSPLDAVPYLYRLFKSSAGMRGTSHARAPTGHKMLVSGEAAEAILDIKSRTGASALAGTVFDEPAELPDAPEVDSALPGRANSRDIFIDLIRALEEEQQAPPSVETAEAPKKPRRDHRRALFLSAVGSRERIDALRKAGRMLEEAADVLEQQNEFGHADEIRDMADRVRHTSRERLREGEESESFSYFGGFQR